MNSGEKELETRLDALPDLYPDFVRLSMLSVKERGLVNEVLEMPDETEGATTETVLAFEEAYCGDIEAYDENGARVPVSIKRLALTCGMRDILANMKGKMFKSYEYAPISSGDHIAECTMRISLSQHAIDSNCYIFAFDIAGNSVDFWLEKEGARHQGDPFDDPAGISGSSV